MPDLLVNLLKLPPIDLNSNRIWTLRRAQPFELSIVRTFVERNFSVTWADELSVGFANKPISIYIAVVDHKLVGFAAYECTRRGFFGPIGVLDSFRGRGIGKALLLSSLWGLKELGYVYGIIGGVGPVRFYQKTVGAIVIPDSEPGIYSESLRLS